ncbi:Aste57867_4070 [Aphanomyces stellatus]|uniref:Aste57867_4070 protein n=1 Tax=Aphanomyces stellatus TaxID=120398 RepID=A0A485KAY4_9STRA|nr:hypothetical protein As57867_004059 [Aphanomyces stellatus]VFT81204.1 Aste57867_4070 [Aphanomyces stellatus]
MSFQKREYDANAKQWMKEALVSREVIDDLESVNRKLKHELQHKTFKLQVMDECISKLGVTAKVQNAIDNKRAPIIVDAPSHASPKRSPRKPPDGLVMGSPDNKFSYSSEDYSNYVGQYSPPKDREISNPKQQPPSEKISPRRLKHDAQLFGSGTEANRFHHGSSEHLSVVENHSPKRTHEVTECPKREQVFVCGSEAFQKSAAYVSTLSGQVERTDYGRSWPFQREEKALHESKDLFGNERKKPGAHIVLSKAESDAIDKLMRESPRIKGNNHHYADFKG